MLSSVFYQNEEENIKIQVDLDDDQTPQANSQVETNNEQNKFGMPTDPRQKSNFVGLENQGATCYMNSLFQILYMTPQFREFIFSLPLECTTQDDELKDESSTQSSDQIQNQQKNGSLDINMRKLNILRAFQNLFAKMQEGNLKATSTEEVTTSFGWNSEDNHAVREQHDIGELNNILFDAFEKCFKGTDFASFIPDMFFGKQSNFVQCQECGTKRNQTEDFLQLNLQVANCKGVAESLSQLLEVEEMNGDNQVTCESATCQGEKTDSRRGMELTKLPPVLTFCLNRFEFDFDTLQRYKLNERFEYPLELDMSEYLTEDVKQNLPEDETNYELKSIIVHWGGAQGGHYWTYIKDDLQEGNWYLEKEKIEERVEKAADDDSDDWVRQSSTDSRNSCDNDSDESGRKSNSDQSDKKSDRDDSSSSSSDGNIAYNHSRRGRRVGRGRKQYRSKQNKKKQVVWKKKEEQEGRFPLPYSDERLLDNWYDFDDSNVTPIQPSQLKKMFGGENNYDSAYMLIYRQKKLNPVIPEDEINPKVPKMPNYLHEQMKKVNATAQEERDAYEDLKNQFDIIIQEKDQHFSIQLTEFQDEQMPLIKPNDSRYFEAEGTRCSLRVDDTIQDTFNKILDHCDLEEETFELFELSLSWGEKYCRVIRCFSDLMEVKRKLKDDESEDEMGYLTVQEINEIEPFSLQHRSIWLLLKETGPDEKNNELANQLKSYMGEKIIMALTEYEYVQEMDQKYQSDDNNDDGYENDDEDKTGYESTQDKNEQEWSELDNQIYESMKINDIEVVDDEPLLDDYFGNQNNQGKQVFKLTATQNWSDKQSDDEEEDDEEEEEFDNSYKPPYQVLSSKPIVFNKRPQRQQQEHALNIDLD